MEARRGGGRASCGQGLHPTAGLLPLMLVTRFVRQLGGTQIPTKLFNSTRGTKKRAVPRACSACVSIPGHSVPGSLYRSYRFRAAASKTLSAVPSCSQNSPGFGFAGRWGERSRRGWCSQQQRGDGETGGERCTPGPGSAAGQGSRCALTLPACLPPPLGVPSWL